jgi:hypothetical protein
VCVCMNVCVCVCIHVCVCVYDDNVGLSVTRRVEFNQLYSIRCVCVCLLICILCAHTNTTGICICVRKHHARIQ